MGGILAAMLFLFLLSRKSTAHLTGPRVPMFVSRGNGSHIQEEMNERLREIPHGTCLVQRDYAGMQDWLKNPESSPGRKMRWDAYKLESVPEEEFEE